MRELLMRCSNSTESKKRDLCVKEIVEKDGLVAKTEKRSMYFLMGRTHIEDPEDLEKLNELKSLNLPHKKKHFYVLKIHDDKLGEDRLVCKAAGSFYAVCGNELLSIAFVNSFKITFTLAHVAKNGEK